jgi:hypothetical protein
MPELLEQYMDEKGADECWITVQELRERFDLSRYQCNTVSGFLRRLDRGPFGRCPFMVTKIERDTVKSPSVPKKSRYLISRK